MDRTSTITLAISDRFTQPLQHFTQGTEKAVQATDKLAAAGKQSAATNEKVTQSAQQQTAALGNMAEAQKKVTQQTKDHEQAAKAQAKTLSDLKTQALAATAILVGFGAAAKKAWDFAEQGAAVRQTTESFERMMTVVGAAPDTLNQLRAATRGTVDDMTIMSSMQLLLAGTSGQLSQAFTDAAPRLADMAKAAQKINPSLGSTSELFDSIARGIKRSSPLILDNLGIVVKLGPAYEDYAKSIGKAAKELTAEEKQMALLNAVLAKYDSLVVQAGGNTDAFGDSMSRLESKTKSAWETFLARTAAPAGENFAKGALGIFFGQADIEKAAHDQEAVLRRSAKTWEEYQAGLGGINGVLQEARLNGNYYRDEVEGISQAQFEAMKVQEYYANGYKLLAAAMTPIPELLDEETKKTVNWAGIAQARTGYLRALTGHTYEFVTAEERLLQIEAELAANKDFSFEGRLERMTRFSGDWIDELDEMVEKLGNFRAANGAVIPPAENLNDLLLDAAIATDKYHASVEKLNEAQQKRAEETDPEKWAELDRAVRLADRAVRDSITGMQEAGTTAQNAAGGIANYETGIRNTNGAIEEMISLAFESSLLGQLETLADLATKGHDTEAAFLATLDALRELNPELARKMEISHGLSMVQDQLNAGVAAGLITGPEYKTIVENFTKAISEGVPFAEAMAAALRAINEAAKAMPPSGTRWEYEVVTNHYNMNHDVNVSEPGPAAPVVMPTTPSTTPSSGAYASGGHFTVPAGFFNDSYKMGVEQGEEVSVRTARQQREGTNAGATNNMGGVTIIIQQAPGQSARAMAAEVVALLGADSDARRRLGV